jgi:hypothetical protein
MIQRIQTLYLLVAFIATVLFYFFPFATYFENAMSFYEFKITAINHIFQDTVTLHSVPVFMLSVHIILTILVFISIFLFGNRVRQMRVVAVSFLLNAILIGAIFFFSDSFGKEFTATPNYKNFGTLMPVLTLIMLLLANKAIKQDEIKMRKSSRIR